MGRGYLVVSPGRGGGRSTHGRTWASMSLRERLKKTRGIFFNWTCGCLNSSKAAVVQSIIRRSGSILDIPRNYDRGCVQGERGRIKPIPAGGIQSELYVQVTAAWRNDTPVRFTKHLSFNWFKFGNVPQWTRVFWANLSTNYIEPNSLFSLNSLLKIEWRATCEVPEGGALLQHPSHSARSKLRRTSGQTVMNQWNNSYYNEQPIISHAYHYSTKPFHTLFSGFHVEKSMPWAGGASC